MFTPRNQYINLRKHRSNIIIAENKLIHLTDSIGLHPAMNSFKRMYDEELALIIQNVGYPNPNLSHFRSKDIVTSGSPSDVVINTGWMGRYLQYLYPGYPDNFPNEDSPYPVAITIGPTSSATCQGDGSNLSIVLRNLNVNYQQTEAVSQEFPDNPYGHELQFIHKAMTTRTHILKSRYTINWGKSPGFSWTKRLKALTGRCNCRYMTSRQGIILSGLGQKKISFLKK